MTRVPPLPGRAAAGAGGPPLTVEIAQVLGPFLADPARPCYNQEIAALTGLAPDFTWRIISALHRAGWVRDEWSTGLDGGGVLRHRRLFVLTEHGLPEARAARAAVRSRVARIAVILFRRHAGVPGHGHPGPADVAGGAGDAARVLSALLRLETGPFTIRELLERAPGLPAARALGQPLGWLVQAGLVECSVAPRGRRPAAYSLTASGWSGGLDAVEALRRRAAATAEPPRPPGPAVREPGTAEVRAAQLFAVFLAAPGQPRYKAELAWLTGMDAGTAYSALEAMAARGWVTSRRDQGSPGLPAGDRRLRQFLVTPAGRAAAPLQSREARAQIAAACHALGIVPPPATAARPWAVATAEARSQGTELTGPEAKVLRLLLDDPARPVYKAQLARLAQLGESTTLEALNSLSGRGWTRQGERTSQGGGHSKQATFYSLTPDGLAEAPGALAPLQAAAAATAAALRPAPGEPPGPVVSPPQVPAVVTALVVTAFTAVPAQPLYYTDLAGRTCVPGPSLRAALLRMTREGLLSSAEPPAARAGSPGPPGLLYTLTPSGLQAAPSIVGAALRELAAIGGPSVQPVPGR